MHYSILLLLVILTVTVCSDSGGSGSVIAAACKDNLNAPEAACDCLGERADEELSPEAGEWLAAALNQDAEKAQEMRENVDWTELLEASTFMMNISKGCDIPEAIIADME